MTETHTPWYRRLSTPVLIGLGFALVATILALFGIARGAVPRNPISIFLAIVISAGSWGLVSWAVATAVMDVESDLASEDGDE